MRNLFRIGMVVFYIYGTLIMWKALGWQPHPYFYTCMAIAGFYSVLILGKLYSKF